MKYWEIDYKRMKKTKSDDTIVYQIFKQNLNNINLLIAVLNLLIS